MLRLKNTLGHKTVAVILAWCFWWVPIGAHRLWMRQKFWWLHTLCFLAATVASNIFFFHTPANMALGRSYAAHGVAPHLGDYTHAWLLGFTAVWLALIMYDCAKVFSWTVPDVAQRESGNV